MTTVSINELSNPKHPIHLRILNKKLNQQILNQRSLPDYWSANLDNDLNSAYIQQQPQDNYDQNQQSSNYQPFSAIKNLKQYQQLQTNSSIEDQESPLHPNQQIPFNSQMMASGQTQSPSFHQNHQTSLPSTAAQQQTNIQQQIPNIQRNLSNWNKSSAGSTNSQHCKLPSSTWHQLSAGNNKCCYNVAFSNDGTKIACM